MLFVAAAGSNAFVSSSEHYCNTSLLIPRAGLPGGLLLPMTRVTARCLSLQLGSRRRRENCGWPPSAGQGTEQLQQHRLPLAWPSSTRGSSPARAGWEGCCCLCVLPAEVLHLAVWQGEVTLLREGGVQALLDELPKGRLVAERALSQPVVLF